MDRTVDHTWVFMGNGVIKDFPGNYSEYRAWKELHERETAEKDKVAVKSPEKQYNRREASNKLTYKEKQELEKLNTQIKDLTKEKESLDVLFASGETIVDVAEKAARYNDIKEQLDTLELRWLELSEKQ